MNKPDPTDLLFGAMAKLGPGNDADTRHVLRLLPRRKFSLVVDAGCGTGRQTIVLAGELGVPVQAIDTHVPFLDDLRQRAQSAGLGDLVKPRCMDMREIPRAFQEIDLLW